MSGRRLSLPTQYVLIILPFFPCPRQGGFPECQTPFRKCRAIRRRIPLRPDNRLIFCRCRIPSSWFSDGRPGSTGKTPARPRSQPAPHFAMRRALTAGNSMCAECPGNRQYRTIFDCRIMRYCGYSPENHSIVEWRKTWRKRAAFRINRRR